MRLKYIIISIVTFLSAPALRAQIVIGGSVYGGGNEGALGGKATVTVYSGDLNMVYGGARMANVGGNAFVNIDGANASGDILINKVFGGNDISGTIGTNFGNKEFPVPTGTDRLDADSVTKFEITKEWQTFVRTSPMPAGKGMFIGQLYGGGNGETKMEGKDSPDLDRTYLEVKGGTIGYVFGGGNNATVTANTTIYIDNQSEVVTSIRDANGVDILDNANNSTDEAKQQAFERQRAMGLNTTQTKTTSADFQFARVFGGNNKADMAIRPTWYLRRGKIRDLYSGGNEGRMTYEQGLLLMLDASVPNAAMNNPDVLRVGNVYGGCRMADVRPLYSSGERMGQDVDNADIKLNPNPNKLPDGFSARVRVLGGWVENVYGGNDISGDVYGGNSVGIFTTIHGNVYGGGNGSYAYTDNAALKDDELWGDYYYDPDKVLGDKGLPATSSELKSVEALNVFRPNAEQVSIRINGKEDKRTVIEKALYIGSNSATLTELTAIDERKVELKIGSYCYVDTVFLGNNGVNMVDASADGVLEKYAGNVTMADGVTTSDFSSLDLINPSVFNKYMEGCAMRIIPSITFDDAGRDGEAYTRHSTEIGSFFCGGNVGSMLLNGTTTIDFTHDVVIFDKLVGGCNNANVPAHDGLNARYEGGFMTLRGDGSVAQGPTVGDTDTGIDDKLILNLSNLRIEPKRWKGTKDADGNYTAYTLDANGNRQLEWNTINADGDVTPPTDLPSANAAGKHVGTDDLSRRLKGGNIYGGCYSSGHIDGNVVINIEGTILDRWNVFDEVTSGSDKLYTNVQNSDFDITKRNSGVLLDAQGMDPLGLALNVFGGGYGAETEIWGSTTINLARGYTFQVFGGGEQGAIGRGTWDGTAKKYVYADTYDARFSTYINLHGSVTGASRTSGENATTSQMAEAEFIYGGGFEGAIIGDTHVYLGNGRVFNSFAGSDNADIWGHTETFIGLNSDGDEGFPWVRDNTYGGNDLGGRIKGAFDFSDHLSDYMKASDNRAAMHGGTNGTMASAYTEYRQGRVDYIFGGCYGDYDYTPGIGAYKDYNDVKPYMKNAFVNFRPSDYSLNSVQRIYGAGQGHVHSVNVDVAIDKMQDRSYVLIDIPQGINKYEDMAVFGSGSWCGLGMNASPDTPDNTVEQQYSAVVDLFRGKVGNVYGGGFNEGFTRRTVVNVPSVSTITVKNLFGGAYGADPLYPCDVYESEVNYHSENATMSGNIYGGNNRADRTLYAKVNVSVPVWQDRSKGYMAMVFGAGYGENSWAQYTEVNLLDGAKVNRVFGGGENGLVISSESLLKWQADVNGDSDPANDLDIFLYDYPENGLDNHLVTTTHEGGKYNTNVLIHEGAEVLNYAYGGGQGIYDIQYAGDVYGSTFIGLYGGKVDKDIYAAGTVGSVYNRYKVTDVSGKVIPFSTNAYIEGGTARNVYGGGWMGSVGYHDAVIKERPTDDGKTEKYADNLAITSREHDIDGMTNVVIGKLDGTSFVNGIPAIERNAYGGGEGGAVFGTANITLNNGFIGYRYFTDEAPLAADTLLYVQQGSGFYQEKIHDETWAGDGANRLYDSGCIFGGGYVDNSSVDYSSVKMFGGHVRNALFGGGEIAAIGRGIIHLSGEANSERELLGIYKAGKAKVELWDGYVHRNVFGGGRGYNNLGEGGTLYSDGYVFGQAEVGIFGGEVGTEKELLLRNGNVFGGGDIGYVYSAYENEAGELCIGKKSDAEGDEGYYYEYEGGAYQDGQYVGTGAKYKTYGANNEKQLTEDCKVLVEPHCRVKADVTINGHSYKAGDYVTTEDLSTLGSRAGDSTWGTYFDDDDDMGIIIHNAVFAGGNTSSGSAAVYANATTVFGNATASIHDVYSRDLITLGTGHTGGLYGDGNLTFVDGYRGLNITNYGTDYYNLKSEVNLSDFNDLPIREQAYYELRFKCEKECTDNDGKTYTPGSTISEDDLMTVFEGIGDIILDGKPNPEYWTANGVRSRYAGRLMNTIQRADFCGVFGSRMVMRGAQDRVPEIVDYTNYTINRVGEVSLNKRQDHGNYFGIYNIVNYLGALTSDFDFGDEGDGTDKGDVGTGTVRTSNNSDTAKYGPEYEGQTSFGWKKSHINDRTRNNGNSHNQVALASGVYLELTTENSTGTGLREKDWGYITGVIELDLINVQPGIGGGFVYAKNVHGKRTKSNLTHVTLTALNQGAVTRRDFTYAESDDDKYEWETSGNFVHSTQTIIDDCYNVSGRYKGGESEAVPAHYWYIKGQVYVYDQYISAYTGASNAYSEQVEIPLTITAASHGTMKLLNIMPNLYAFYSANTKSSQVRLEGERKIVINDVEYGLNDPISYWDWYLLSPSEQALFVEDTYVVKEDCKIGAVSYTAGQVLLSEEYQQLIASGKPAVKQVREIDGAEKEIDADFDFLFRSSNNLSHDTGYILTYKVNNPSEWNNWYTKVNSDTHEKTQSESEGYDNGPTYRLKDGISGSMLGMRGYVESNIISQDVYNTYLSAVGSRSDIVPTDNPEDPGYDASKVHATFERAYIVIDPVTIPASVSEPETHYFENSVVSATEAARAELSGKAQPAYISTHTIKLSPTEYIYLDTKMTEVKKQEYYDRFKGDDPDVAKDIQDYIVPAYYCTKGGLYGGDYYEQGKNYRGLNAWSSMSEEDRKSFVFNYDALDLLIDPKYSRDADGHVVHPDGQKYQYDSEAGTLAGAEANIAGYSLEQRVNYSATYDGTSTLTYTGGSVTPNAELTREQFEEIPNEQRHYSAIEVGDRTTIYVVSKSFLVGNTPYAVGTTIAAEVYENLGGDEKKNITMLTFSEADANKKFYFCREAYTVRSDDDGTPVAAADGVTAKNSDGNAITVDGSYGKGVAVPVGLVIDAANYTALVEHNKQKDFTIHGIAPTEVSTLYVSRYSDIFDLSKDKIITVIYEYNYEESDASGNITPISERHVVNIHIQFKSGVPEIEDIRTPQIIRPGTKLKLIEPRVSPGAYEVTGGGWELFEKLSDAEARVNGIEYVPNSDLLYWYQHGYYVAYYAKTYLGKTYSRPKPVSVANYHDLKRVMDDTEHHYYIDNNNVKRKPKIYINDYTDTSQSGIELLRDLISLSHIDRTYDADGKPVAISADGPLKGHVPLDLTNADKPMRGGEYLEFFLRKDQDYTGAWTPIANADGECFSGTLHGDGHTISGLDNSLFNHLCGDVYNLGVTGSFTGAGVAETGEGYVENCWISTTGTPVKEAGVNHFPVFGNPSREAGSADPVQVVNCYYHNDYTNAGANDPHGRATLKPARAFYNGEVTYDLNGFYLNKRYCDNSSISAPTATYSYFKADADGTLVKHDDGKYIDNISQKHLCSSGYKGVKYVEDCFEDGDFIYAGETFPPETADDREYVDANENVHYYPIWPDDYLFFGQRLTYGHERNKDNGEDLRPHQPQPTYINKTGDNNRLATASTDVNRVYRAPAYFRSKTMGVAHYNPYAVFAAKSADETREVYPGMTAIDFTGGNGDVSRDYAQGDENKFYPPLLDNDGLESFRSDIDLTKNLLVYTHPQTSSTSEDASSKTYRAVNSALEHEPEYAETNTAYRTVAAANTTYIYGHHVVRNGEEYQAPRDHFLVDRHDFNAPIAYSFASGKRMWYQRTPDLYVDRTKGWEGVSLPFAAELVTAHQKGEITHFYGGSNESLNDTHSKIGHEYWLREFGAGGKVSSTDGTVFEAAFNNPTAAPAGDDALPSDKDYTNTFLWDTYYSKSARLDANSDIYQEYYRNPHQHAGYAYADRAKPYIIGFPGATYYEFDLSGRDWTPLGTYSSFSQEELPKQQVITFASKTGAKIQVSDDEQLIADTNNNNDGYVFKSNYLNQAFAAGTADTYTLNGEGSSFDLVPDAGDDVEVLPFRPYFVKAGGDGARETTTRSIIFRQNESQLGGAEDNPHLRDEEGASLSISSKHHKIIVTSALRAATDIRIVSVSGITIAAYTIEPGESVETRVNNSGVYIVRTADSRYLKKLAVR